jgi:hypothetical protein
MIRIAIRILLTALVFTYIVPMISGAHFAGSFWPEGIIYGLLMAVVAYLCGWALALITIGTAGIAAIFLIFSFWLIPAAELRILAHFFPQNLAFDGWFSAIIAGLILLVVNMITAKPSKK